MRKLIAAMVLGMLLCMQLLWAQNQVTGRVTDARDNNPLAGVTVTIKETRQSAVTSNEGTFSINAPANSTLVFSYVGYQTVERPASGTVNVVLTPRANDALN